MEVYRNPPQGSVVAYLIALMSAIVNPSQTATYTRGVKAILLNRILLVLSFIGLFVAGALSIEKLMNVSLPCGNTSGCDKVAAHPSSMLFGVIPVAYIGLAGYILFAALAIIRSMKTPWDVRLVNLGFGAAAFGAAFSLYLQYISFFTIHAVCPYCLTSAITMIATFVVYFLLTQAVKADPPPAGDLSKPDTFLIGGLPFLVIVALALLGGTKADSHLDKGKIELNMANLVPANPNSFGPADAPITVIEFADMCCPTCQRTAPKLKEFAIDHSKSIRVIFRNYPLKKHEFSHLAALMGEYAGEKGKFWDFTMSVMGLNREPDSATELFEIAKSVGLDTDDLRKRLLDNKDPIYDLLATDISVADKVGVDSTPSFIILAKGVEPTSCGSNVVDKLKEPAYAKLLQ